MGNHYSSIIQEYILSSRIKTKRQKKRAIKKDRDKQLIQLGEELKSIRNQQREQGYVDLIPPIMRGWKRYFVLRTDIAKTKQASFFEEILEKINTIEYSSKKDFKKKKRKFGKKIYVEKQQHLKKLCEYCFNKAMFTEKQKELFEMRYEQDSCTKKLGKVFVFTQPWRFVLRVRPNMITKIRVQNVALEKREVEIKQYLHYNNWKRLHHLLYGYVNYKEWRYKSKSDQINDFKNKSIVDILDILNV